MLEPNGCADKLVMFITTNRRVEKFIPFVRDAINKTWPSSPRFLFLTDGDRNEADVLHCGSVDFVTLLLEGLENTLRRHPGVTHLFHMLEDHVPLRPLPVATVEGFLHAAVRHNLAAAAFTTYKWPWQDIDNQVYEDGLIRTWPKIETTTFDDRRFAVVPRDFFRYFQVQPTVWRAEYLLRVLSKATSLGITDPWNFEALRIDDAEQHYVADYGWPTVHHGFLAQGTVNEDAIKFIDGKLLPEFKRQLMSEFSGSDRIIDYYAKSAKCTAKHVIGRVSRRIRRMM